ncbi:MAG: endonuclease III [Chloroflexi bacterium]|nr:endonuclease III [Chloroflexota bacterium]
MPSRISPTRRRKLAPPRNLPVPVDLIFEKLLPLYGPIEWQPRYNALDELIFTVLTQHTSDLNAERAFDELRRRISTWEQVLEADVLDIADAIQHGGLANQKSVRIQKILGEILERHGRLELEFLKELDVEAARTWLTQLSGVGPKTAAVVMAFALGMPAMPVDTHIHRVSGRLGLIRKGTSADDAHVVLEKLVDPDDRFPLHVLLITHGRQICKARRPLCGECPIADRCPARDKLA